MKSKTIVKTIKTNESSQTIRKKKKRNEIKNNKKKKNQYKEKQREVWSDKRGSFLCNEDMMEYNTIRKK